MTVHKNLLGSGQKANTTASELVVTVRYSTKTQIQITNW